MDRASSSELCRKVQSAAGDKVDRPLGRTFGESGPLLWASDERRPQPLAGGRLEIPAMSGAHQAFAGFEVESFHRREIHRRRRFEISGEVRAQDCIPAKVI